AARRVATARDIRVASTNAVVVRAVAAARKCGARSSSAVDNARAAEARVGRLIEFVRGDSARRRTPTDGVRTRNAGARDADRRWDGRNDARNGSRAAVRCIVVVCLNAGLGTLHRNAAQAPE